MTTVYTIGHSNTPAEVLLSQLRDAGIKTLIDVRRYPSSRRNPQFNSGALTALLRQAGIEYRHFEDLGGRREPIPESPNRAIPNDALRGYADYTSTPQFQASAAQLLALAENQPTTVMCAEGSPVNCHRSFLADALVGAGHEVIHIVAGELKRHELAPIARIDNGRVTYPALL